MMKTLSNIFIWGVAIAFTIAAFCTFAAWVVGITICLMRWLNG